MITHPSLHATMDNRRASIVQMPTQEQIEWDQYKIELAKTAEQERRMFAPQRDQFLTKPPRMPNRSPSQQSYASAPVHGTPQMHRRVTPSAPLILPISRSPIKPLRIVIIRHAERVDAVLGSDWSKRSFNQSGEYLRSSEHLPHVLPKRSYPHQYVIDVPLTNRGLLHAFKTGKTLLSNDYAIDVCYSSPSLRCVQSADRILAGMGRKEVPLKLEPGLFECYLNDFKRTLCFMTKDELASNGYRVDRSYKPLMPFLRPQDSQLDYYNRCRTIMDVITERHQATGGTIMIVAHAPSLEGLTRHLSGGKVQPEKLFEIARRVPFLAMTIIEKKSLDSPWFFRAEPLQTTSTRSSRELATEIISPMTIPPLPIQNYSTESYGQIGQSRQQSPNGQVRLPNGPILIDPKKIGKSSTEPNMPISHSRSRMFRVV